MVKTNIIRDDQWERIEVILPGHKDFVGVTAKDTGIQTSLPGRYAKVLFDLAQEEGQVENVGASLRSLEKLIQSSKILS